jgi:linalool 8-monooxygenase
MSDSQTPTVDPYDGQRTTPGPVHPPRYPMNPPVDFESPDTFLQGFPYEAFSGVHESAPIFWHPETKPYEPGFWVLTRFEDVRQVSKDPTLFSSAKGAGPMLSFEGSGYDMTPEMLTIYRANMVGMDPPVHRAYRSVVAPYLSGPAVKRLESAIQDRVSALLDAIEVGRPFDLVQSYSAVTPAVALCHLLGVPPQDHQRIIDWGDALAGAEDPEYAAVAMSTRAEAFAYGWQLLDQKKAEPGQDLLTAAIEAYSASDTQLPFGSMEGLFAILLIAGHRTTRNTITSGLLTLYEHPQQLELIRKDPELIDNAVEEILRYTTVVPMFRRTATANTELSGQSIAAGEKVVMSYSLANRDPAVFDHPGTFDVQRGNAGQQLAFGWAEHMCVGRKLARLELKIAIQEFVKRFCSLDVVESPRFLRTNQAISIKHVGVVVSE